MITFILCIKNRINYLKKAILVTYPDKFVIQEALGLAEAADYKVIKLVTQKYLLRAKYGIGSGKAEELKNMIKGINIDAILFDEKLRSVQIYNLAKLTGVEVIDRERLILEIFNKRASSAEAKLQVQLAELKYEIPRAREKVRLAKIGEQPGFFGLGRYDVDDYYRMIRRRIAVIMKKLKQVSKRRELYRSKRLKVNLPLISFAGYTGAGKTSLFNILVRESKDIGKGLFTTLTTTTRSLKLSESKVLISDTVGFISRLPPYMIEAFKATLEELTYANLILLVIDASEPLENMIRKYQSCVNILAELGVSPLNILPIFNKFDLTNMDEIKEKMKVLNMIPEDVVITSAKTSYGIDMLISKINEMIYTRSLTKSALL
ncbi:MAG: GTPase HflX [Nitrososphaerales archaeon]